MTSRRLTVPALYLAAALALAVVAGAASWHSSPTTDEPIHLLAGLDHAAGASRLNFEHPPLAKLGPALLLRAAGVEVPEPALESYLERPTPAGWRALLRALFPDPGTTMARLRLARLAPLASFVLLLWTVGMWGRDLTAAALYGTRTGVPAARGAAPGSGDESPTTGTGLAPPPISPTPPVHLWPATAGLVALLLVGAHPVLLAHAPLIHTDVPLTAWLTLSGWLCWRACRTAGAAPARRHLPWAAAACLALGLALATKFSALLFLPPLGLALLAGLPGPPVRRLLRAGALLALALLPVVALGLLTAHRGELGPAVAVSAAFLPCPPEVRTELHERAHRLAAVPAVGPYLVGMDRVRVHDRDCGAVNFFRGALHPRGHPAYFPTALLIKSPLAWLLLVAAAFAPPWRGSPRAAWVLVAVAVGYLAVSTASSYNIGVRHLMPLFPALTLFAVARLVPRLARVRRPRLRRTALAAAGLALAACLAEPLAAYPDLLEHFSPVAGGRHAGARTLNDSNFDWGQDVYRLWRLAAERGEPVRLFSDGYLGPFAEAGLVGRMEPRRRLPAGLYAIGSFTEARLEGLTGAGTEALDESQAALLRLLAPYREPVAALHREGRPVADLGSLEVLELERPVILPPRPECVESGGEAEIERVEEEGALLRVAGRVRSPSVPLLYTFLRIEPRGGSWVMNAAGAEDGWVRFERRVGRTEAAERPGTGWASDPGWVVVTAWDERGCPIRAARGWPDPR